jgi:hypothetical protein
VSVRVVSESERASEGVRTGVVDLPTKQLPTLAIKHITLMDGKKSDRNNFFIIMLSRFETKKNKEQEEAQKANNGKKEKKKQGTSFQLSSTSQRVFYQIHNPKKLFFFKTTSPERLEHFAFCFPPLIFNKFILLNQRFEKTCHWFSIKKIVVEFYILSYSRILLTS